MLHRRGFLSGVFSAFAAPAIVRFESLMPVRAIDLIEPFPANVIFTGGLDTEYVRRAFMPRVFVQLYRENPALAAMLDMRP